MNLLSLCCIQSCLVSKVIHILGWCYCFLLIGASLDPPFRQSNRKDEIRQCYYWDNLLESICFSKISIQDIATDTMLEYENGNNSKNLYLFLLVWFTACFPTGQTVDISQLIFHSWSSFSMLILIKWIFLGTQMLICQDRQSLSRPAYTCSNNLREFSQVCIPGRKTYPGMPKLGNIICQVSEEQRVCSTDTM